MLTVYKSALKDFCYREIVRIDCLKLNLDFRVAGAYALVFDLRNGEVLIGKEKQAHHMCFPMSMLRRDFSNIYLTARIFTKEKIFQISQEYTPKYGDFKKWKEYLLEKDIDISDYKTYISGKKKFSKYFIVGTVNDYINENYFGDMFKDDNLELMYKRQEEAKKTVKPSDIVFNGMLKKDFWRHYEYEE